MTGACLSENPSLPATVVQHSSQARPALARPSDACISLSCAWRFCRFMGCFFFFFWKRAVGGARPQPRRCFPRPSRTARGPGAALLTAASAQRGRGRGSPPPAPGSARSPRGSPSPPAGPGAAAGGRAGGAARPCTGLRGPGAGGRHLRGGGEGWAVPRQQGGTAPGGCSQHSWGRSFGVYFVLFFFLCFCKRFQALLSQPLAPDPLCELAAEPRSRCLLGLVALASCASAAASMVSSFPLFILLSVSPLQLREASQNNRD